jgi:MOSC domain-containing protein YiiM
MRLLSINVGQAAIIGRRGAEPVRSGIRKAPVSGAVTVGTQGVAGDAQADLVNHGGPDKAVYAYDRGDAVFWEERLKRPLPSGALGENLTVEGRPSDLVRVGDRYRIGTALLEVTQPRVPCYKLGIHMGDAAFPGRFAKALRIGFYLRVLEPGSFRAGDPIEIARRADTVLSVADLMDIYLNGRSDPGRLAAAAALAGLSAVWRDELSRRLAETRGVRPAS